MHADKLGQVTNFTVVCGTAKHCVNQYVVLFHCYLLRGDTAMPGGLHARLCHAFLVLLYILGQIYFQHATSVPDSLACNPTDPKINTSGPLGYFYLWHYK